jgi:hypothetical protein
MTDVGKVRKGPMQGMQKKRTWKTCVDEPSIFCIVFWICSNADEILPSSAPNGSPPGMRHDSIQSKTEEM